MKLLDISAGYGKNIIVKNVSLDIKKGEVISLIGPNGGGKSTFLKTISGRLKPLGGSVMIDEKDLYKIPLKSRSKILAIRSLYIQKTAPERNEAGMRIIGFEDISASLMRKGTAIPINDTGPAKAVTVADKRLERTIIRILESLIFTPTLSA